MKHAFPIQGTLFTLAFCFWVSTVWSQRTFTPEAIRADLSFLQQALYRGHPGVFRYNPRDSMDAFFENLRSHVPTDSVTYDQAQVLVRLAVARVRDGHTSVETPFYDETTRVLPLTMQIVDNEAYILRDYAGDTLSWRGAELLSVNGIPAMAVIRVGRLLAFGDGYSETFRDVSASVFFSRNLRLLFGTPAVSRVELKWPDGRKEIRQIRSRPRSEILALMSVKSAGPPPRQPVFRYRDMALYQDTLFANLAVLQLGSFPSGHYQRFYRKTFRWLDRHHIDHLVVDVRFNTGGNVGNLENLLTHILDERASYQFERRRSVRMGKYFNTRAKIIKGLVWFRMDLMPSYRHRRDGVLKIRRHTMKPRRHHNFDGKVFVLTNGWSFSSASMAASFLQHRGGAAVLGTETGGCETGNCGGGYPKLVLPNTRIKVRFPLNFVRYDVKQPNRGRGVQPDYPSIYRMDDYLLHRDLEMEKVYELMKKEVDKG